MKFLIIQPSPDWGGTEELIATLVSAWRHRVKVWGVSNYPPLIKSWRRSGAKVIRLPFIPPAASRILRLSMGGGEAPLPLNRREQGSPGRRKPRPSMAGEDVILDIAGDWKGLIKAIMVLPYAVLWYWELLSRAKKAGVNAIILTGFGEKLLVSWLGSLIKLPVIWFEYPPLKTQFSTNFGLPQILYRASVHLPKLVIAISQHTQKSLVSDAGISPDKIRVIYPGVTIPAKVVVTNRPVVGHLSRLTPEKGQRLLLRAWKQVIAHIPEAKLKIAGRGPDATYLKQRVKDLGLTDSVEFLGFIDDKNSFYRSLKLFVFPTIWEMEGFGLVAAEALSYGLPVVAFDHGPVSEIVTPKVGILIKKKQPTALAQAIIKLLKDNEAYQSLREQTRKHASTYFNLRLQSNLILKEITDVLKTS